MIISIISVFPQLFSEFLKTSFMGRTTEKNIHFNLIRFSDFCSPKERIDEPIAGPGPGMLIKPEVMERCIEHCQAAHGKGFIIFFSPQGTKLEQPLLQAFANHFFDNPALSSTDNEEKNKAPVEKHIILVCPRYEGIDARIEQHYADAVISIGDYITMGGDLPAQVFLEGLLRLMPNLLGNAESITDESFQSSYFDYPSYSQSSEWKGYSVPAILKSGNHKLINEWRIDEACRKTILNRFDWFSAHVKDKKEIERAQKYIPNHYVVLMHDEVGIKGHGIGTTSITSIDLHDIARSSATYGLKNFFIVTPLQDQKAIMDEFLGFWTSKIGADYNPGRSHAVQKIMHAHSLDEAIAIIEKKENKKPILITTSAKNQEHAMIIDYTSQGAVWKYKRPILFILGTGQGLSDSVIARSDFLLHPLQGMSDFNHLSVRSAAAIIFDRWLGLQTIKSAHSLNK